MGQLSLTSIFLCFPSSLCKSNEKMTSGGDKKIQYNTIQYNIIEGNSVAFLCSKQNVSHHSTYLPALNTISVVIKRSWFPYTFNDTESCSQRVTEWKVELRTPTKHDHTVCAEPPLWCWESTHTHTPMHTVSTPLSKTSQQNTQKNTPKQHTQKS